MPANYVLLEKITVGAAGASSVTFNSIPQTGYTDLVLKMSVRTDRASTDDLLNFNFNGVSTNQSSRNLQGNGSTASSGTYGSNLYLAWVDAASNTASTFGNAEMYIPNYTSSNFKSISTDGVLENNATTAVMGMTAGLWSSTAAITSIAITSVFSANFVSGSTFYLYGVAKLGTTPAIVPYATGGDTIMTDGTYWYHTFLSSGTFTPAKALSCDYLVVAGGGGGAQNGTTQLLGGGGGGGGGFRTSIGGSPLSLGTSAYTVTVGAGGAGGGTNGSKGSNSVFASITSTGGGTGGSFNAGSGTFGTTGGSGGGGGYDRAGGAGNEGGYSPVEGYAGGSGQSGNNNPAGGGGGAGGVGANSTTNNGGNGGTGASSSISGSSVTYGGGGGGGTYNGGGGGGGGVVGTGGAGGGGNAGTVTVGGNGSPGTANSGGGGGGASTNAVPNLFTGGAGGSGIVIVRYAV